MKRNLMDELKEGIDSLAKRREMSKLYIVIRQDYHTGFGIFCKVFFKRALAEDWIHSRRNPEDYNIETYQEQEDGTTLEVYEI
jgi:hypothetical protein